MTDRHFFTGHSVFDTLFPEFAAGLLLETKGRAAAFNDTGTWQAVR